MRTRKARRTVVTGIGVVAPNGNNTEAFWKRTHEGMSVLDRVTREGCEHLPLRVAGEVRGFEAVELIEERFLVQTDKFTHFAMAAADIALDDARLGRADYENTPFDVGVVTAAGSGGGEFGQRELQRLWGQGSTYVGPYQSIAWFYAASTGQISIRGGFKGPCAVVASDEAAWSGRAGARRPFDPRRHRGGGGRRGGGPAGALLGRLPARVRGPEHRRGPHPRLPAVHLGRLRLRAGRGRRHAGGRGGAVGAAGAAPGSGPKSPGTPPRSPERPGGRSPGRASPRRSSAPFGRPTARRTRSMSSSRTPSAYPRPTAPRRWRSPTPSVRTASGCR